MLLMQEDLTTIKDDMIAFQPVRMVPDLLQKVSKARW